MQRHRKTFRAFNGQECWNEPLTLHPPEGYVGTHRQTDGEAYLQSEHLEWLLAGKPESYA